MIVEDQLDRGAGRIGGIEKFEEFDELFAAVAISDESVDLSSEQPPSPVFALDQRRSSNSRCSLPIWRTVNGSLAFNVTRSAGSRARWLARARRRWVSGSSPACGRSDPTTDRRRPEAACPPRTNSHRLLPTRRSQRNVRSGPVSNRAADMGDSSTM
jgi:hypothetical protein